MANNISENLFQAVDVILSSRLSELEYDKTLVCTIESADNAKKGEYRVTDGSSHFLAYSENTEYAVGAKVYVTVPNGDMGNQKIITGKYVATDEAEYFDYVSPLNNFIDITGNLIDVDISYSLLANDPDRKEIKLWERKGISLKQYERLGISAEFQTWLASLNAASGSYGLKLNIVAKNEEGHDVYTTLKLDVDDMYGNPYNFSNYFKQEKLFDISHLFEITQIGLILYQNENFINELGEMVPYYEEQNNSKVKFSDNIFMRNPYISVGYSLDNFTEDMVILGTQDSLSYQEGALPQARSIYMRWIHQNNEKFYSIDESAEIPENAVIHWYRYKIEPNRKDELAGNFWQEITPSIDLFNHTFIPDYTSSTDMFKVIIEYPNRQSVIDTLESTNSDLVVPLQEIDEYYPDDYNAIRQKIFEMCESDNIETINEIYTELVEKYADAATALDSALNIILEAKGTINYYTSDNLIFTNEIPQDLVALDLIQGLTLTCDENGYQGVYRIYDETNSIVNTIEATKLRNITAHYSSVITNEEGLNMAEEITWYIPVQNSMIEEPIAGKEFDIANGDIYLPLEESGMEGYVAIKRQGTEIAGEVDEDLQLIETVQTFRIKNYYTQTATNNTVYCVVRKNNRDYKASITLSFGTTGSNGTEATFLLQMYEDDKYSVSATALNLGGSKRLYIKPFLYDYNNKPVDIKANEIKYSWYTPEVKNQRINISTSGINAILTTTLAANDIFEGQFHILKATLPWTVRNAENQGESEEEGRVVNLEAFLPIPVKVNNEYGQIEGPTKVIYDVSGTNPRYYKEPFKLYPPNSLTPIEDIEWIGYSPDFDEDSSIKYYPRVSLQGEFVPVNMYFTGLQPFCVNALKGSDIVWTQPILIIQNRYASAMLNGWSGDLTIDENNGIILSSMIGAGIKNADNSFSGVLMGDIDQAYDGRKTGLGIYGFHKGEQSFGFNSDGTAFIGKSGRGRINFEGNKGTISSGNYSPDNKSGMLIDLDDALLNAYGEAGAFELNMDPADKKPLLNIRDFEGKNLFYLSGVAETGEEEQATQYYIQSSNYNRSKKRGMRIDLQNSTINAYGSGGSVIINANDNNSLFTVNGIGKVQGQDTYKPLINISSNNYFLRSIDFNSSTVNNRIPTGFNLDLSDGRLTAFNFRIQATDSTSGSQININSEGNPYFNIYHSSSNKYENVPVFKIYEPNKYYYLENGTYERDSSANFTEDRVYYDDDQGSNALNIVDKNLVYGKKYGNVFYILNEDEITEGYRLVPTYVAGIQYYLDANGRNPITVVNNAYAYEAGKFYTVSENNEFILDTSEYYNSNRTYYDSEHREVTDILDNAVYRNFNTERSNNRLYILNDGYYKLDTSSKYTEGRIYYRDSQGATIANIVSDEYEIFKINTYYQKVTINGNDTYTLVNTYYENMQYYKDVVTDSEGKQTATPVLVASPDSVHYQSNTYYYYVSENWQRVTSSMNFDQSAIYGILENGEYNSSYIITDSNLVYYPNKYYYIASSSTKYNLSYSYDSNVQYYIDNEGIKEPVNVILETSTTKIFRANTYYRYYSVEGQYIKADGEYSSYNTYYKYDSNTKEYILAFPVNGEYEFKSDKFYIYSPNGDNYVKAGQFLSVPYYILVQESQNNNLIRVTKNKFELKSHDWDVSKRIGMHFDISGSGGYLEGYSEYTNTNGEVVRPKFILDWRKNGDPIDVNNGIFKVKWNGETICSNIRASGGKIGGWAIDGNNLVASGIILRATPTDAGIIIGNLPSDFLDNLNGSETISDISSILTTKEFFSVDKSGLLRCANAQIDKLVVGTISTNELYVEGRKYKERDKKQNISFTNTKYTFNKSTTFGYVLTGYKQVVINGKSYYVGSSKPQMGRWLNNSTSMSSENQTTSASVTIRQVLSRAD